MIYSSLAILAVAASAAMPPIGPIIHLHPHAKVDDRVNVTLVNHSNYFRDVKIDGHIYELTAGRALSVKAPAGTLIYRASFVPFHTKGEVLVALTPDMDRQIVDVK